MYRIAVILLCGLAAAQTNVLEQAAKTIGNPKSIQFTGSGAQFTLGQNKNPSVPWPRVELKSATWMINYETKSARIEPVGPQGPAAVQFVSEDKAWSQAVNGNTTPTAPSVASERQLHIWMTPHGFLQAALAAKATVKGRRVSFMHGPHRLVGTLSPDGTVERVETWVDNPVLGDMPLEMAYADYKDFGGGIKFPTKITQKAGGFPVLELTVSDVRADVPVNVTVPDSVRTATPPEVKVASEKLADGVWYLTGGSHHSVVVEFKDHVAVIEAPQSEARSTAVIAEVKKLVPHKPIRYLVSTHHHFDHSGGLRTYVAEGATVVTHQTNTSFYQAVAKAPHKLNADRLAREKKKLKLVPVNERYALTDGARTVELHHIQGSPHHDGILMAYLPQEKILVEADVYTPPAANAPPPATPQPATVNLYENIERLKLDVERIAPLHGRLVTLADLKTAAGK